MTNIKQYFTQSEVVERAIELVEHYDNDELIYVSDLVHDIGETDYYVAYYSEAVEALQEYGIFEALGEVKEYELNTLGEVYTDLSDPVSVANTLWYIKVGELLYNLSEDRYEVGELIEELDELK